VKQRPVNNAGVPTQRRRQKLMLALILMILLLTLKPAWAIQTSDADSLVTIRASSLIRGTAALDSLDLALSQSVHRVTELDSLRVSDQIWFQVRLDEANERAELWKAEATSWWKQNESAFWVAIGVALSAFALK